MFNSRSIQGLIVLAAGTFLAIWLGLSIVTNQIETILQMVLAAALIGCISLGRRIWLLIPFMAAVNIGLRIPGQPTSLLLGQIMVLGFSGILFLMRKLPFKLAWTDLELWVLVITACVFQVYVRNPVGLNVFGGDTVGGKGYVIFAITWVSALLFAGLRVPANELKWVLRLSIFGGILNTAISVLGNLVPTIGFYTGAAYSTADDGGVDTEAVDTRAATRVGYMLGVGNNLALWISSYMSPLRACLRPLWLILVLMALAAALLSGFRNGIMTVTLTFLVGIAYRQGVVGVLISCFGAISAVALLAVVNTMAPLPPNIQRALTFLPGTWEERYRLDADSSSEWRFEIWREVLLTDRWIQNKWLGDGLGFSAAELAAQMNDRKGARSGISGFEAHRDIILSNGDYHSGPVSVIRVIGYVGLIILLLAMARLSIHAHRQILRCRGTEWFPLSLFVGIPLITGPLIFLFLIGDFRSGNAFFLVGVGMIRLLENNIPLPAFVKRSRLPYLLPTGHRARLQEQREG